MSNEQHHLVGKKVELSPATDAWMSGDRYGLVQEIVTRTNKRVVAYVLMDRSNKIRHVPLELLEEI